MRSPAASLPTFKIPVAGGGAALARLQNIRIHSQAHRASRFAPFESRIQKNLMQAFLLRRALHRLRSRHHHRSHICIYMMAASHARRRPQILQPRICARPDEYAVDADVFDPLSLLQAHILQSQLSCSSVGFLQTAGLRHSSGDGSNHPRIRPPGHERRKLRRIDLHHHDRTPPLHRWASCASIRPTCPNRHSAGRTAFLSHTQT